MCKEQGRIANPATEKTPRRYQGSHKQAGDSLEGQNYCAEIKIRGRPPGPKPRDRSHDATDPTESLADIGIMYDASSRWPVHQVGAGTIFVGPHRAFVVWEMSE